MVGEVGRSWNLQRRRRFVMDACYGLIHNGRCDVPSNSALHLGTATSAFSHMLPMQALIAYCLLREVPHIGFMTTTSDLVFHFKEIVPAL
jgi:hypothetical protein